jgi:hypothetical protein
MLMETELISREALLALLNHSVLGLESSDEAEDVESPDDGMEELGDSEDELEDESGSSSEDESEYYMDYGYLSSLISLSTIGAYAYDATQEVNAINAQTGMAYEERMQAFAAIEKRYRMNTIPYVVELIEHVFEMVDEVDEQAAALFEQMSLLHVLGYAYYSTNGTEARSAVMRTMLTKQLIDAYVLTR